MTEPRWLGSSSDVYQIEPGKVLKVPRECSSTNPNHEIFNRDRTNGFKVEREIYALLGTNELILPFYGCRELQGRQGLLLAQADCTLQDRLQDETTTLADRKRWCCQAAGAVAYIHSRGVMHSDIRPENFLVHGQDIWLSDFNGSVCEERGLDGGQLPDSGFWNLKLETSLSTDIFALGSVLYAILTGWWPFCKPGAMGTLDNRDVDNYDVQVTRRFEAGEFPDVGLLWSGHIILGCWTEKYTNAADVQRDLESAMQL